jgi:hypothetical protein
MNNLDRIVIKLDSILGAMIGIFMLLAFGLLIFWINQRPFEKLDLTVQDVEAVTYNQPILIENPSRDQVRLDGAIVYEALIQTNGSYQLQILDNEPITFSVQIYSNQIPYILYVSLAASLSISIILFIRRRYLV